VIDSRSSSACGARDRSPRGRRSPPVDELRGDAAGAARSRAPAPARIRGDDDEGGRNNRVVEERPQIRSSTRGEDGDPWLHRLRTYGRPGPGVTEEAGARRKLCVPASDEHPRSPERARVQHPHRVSVARCENCGRTALHRVRGSVRNAVYGVECLPAMSATTSPRRPRPRRSRRVSGSDGRHGRLRDRGARHGPAVDPVPGGLGLRRVGASPAARRCSPRSRPACGLVASILAWREMRPALIPRYGSRRSPSWSDRSSRIARPPAFAPAWLGPWVTLAGGVAATALGSGSCDPPTPNDSTERDHARSA